MKTIAASLFVLMLAGSALADPPAPTTSSDAVDMGGVLVTVVVGNTNVQAEPLTIRVEMKNTLSRPVRLYTSTSRWRWRFTPLDGSGYWKLSPQFQEDRILSASVQSGRSVEQSFTTHSARGQEYVFDWVGEGKSPVQDNNSLPVGRYRLTIDMVLSTFSRPTTQPEPWEGKLTTTPVEFEVVGQKPAASSQPAADAFQIKCKRPEDRVAVTVADGSTVFAITSPSGIGEATIERKGDVWPRAVVLRLNLRWLEKLVISNGTMELSASVNRRTGGVRLLADGKELAGTGSGTAAMDPLWMSIQSFDATDDKGHYFGMTLPKAMLDEKAKVLTIKWIDYYRK